jgi:protein-tyrosine phosphatase
MSARALAFDACLNVRDLGGIVVPGGTTRPGAVVRADSLCRLSAEGRDALVRFGIRTVVDLRRRSEIEVDPNPFRTHEAITYHHLPLESAVAFALMPRVETGELADQLIVDLSRRNVARVFQTMANAPEGGIIFHCAAGKDRTGIVAALLLSLVGATVDAIVEDYVLSDVGLGRFHAQWLADAHPLDRDRVRGLIVCRPERPAALLEHVARRYGGVERYLLGAGVEPTEIERLRARLLAERA